MPERWLDGSTRPIDEAVEPMRALVARLVGPGFGIERAIGGMSTPVYRLLREGECLYLRVSEDRDGSMRAEAAVHDHLRAAGVSVPEVLAVDDAPEIGRGVMLVREMPGEPLADALVDTDRVPILRAAGRDLARINAVGVEGFGWIRRDEPVWPLRGEDATYEGFVTGASASVALVADRLTSLERRALHARFEQATADQPTGRLVHGDFDATHIYQCHGSYAGVIDLGEMRGAESHYDLAYFHVQDTGAAMLGELVAGYAEVTAVPADFEDRIGRSAVVIVATQLARWIGRDGIESLDRQSGRWWLARLRALLDGAT